MHAETKCISVHSTNVLETCIQIMYTLISFSCADALSIPRALLGAGSGQIWLDNVQCRGTEARLIDCLANPLGTHDCVHSEDAGVRCSSKI